MIPYMFFVASAANLSGQYLGHPLFNLFKVSDQTIKGIALAKFSEALVVVVTILVLIGLAPVDFSLIFVQWGNLYWGLLAGVLGFSVFAIIAWFQAKSMQIAPKTLKDFLPWILVFVFANAFMEELWFRGIFLKTFEPAIGAWGALILTGIFFTLAHIGATYLSRAERIQFLIILFPLGLIWGFLMQFTDSLLASTLFHAGADLMVVNGFVAAFSHDKSLE